MTATNTVSIILLAGGEARRLPGKLSLKLNGEPLLVDTFKRLTARTGRPCIISIRAQFDPELRARLPAPMVIDRYSSCGPLGGLLSAAETVQTPLFFAAAGDLPLISAAFIDRLEEHYRTLTHLTKCKPVALLPRRSDGRVEPLAALYDTAEFVAGATAALRSGEKKVTAAVAGRPVSFFELDPAGEHELSNVNTAADWQRLQA